MKTYPINFIGITNHYKDPYETTRTQWKVSELFFCCSGVRVAAAAKYLDGCGSPIFDVGMLEILHQIAPVDMENIPFLIGFVTSQVFRWISSIGPSTVFLLAKRDYTSSIYQGNPQPSFYPSYLG